MFRSLSLQCFNCRVNEKGAPSSGGNLRYNLREQYNWSYWISHHQQQQKHMGKFSHFSPLLGPGGEYYNHLGDSIWGHNSKLALLMDL